MTGNSTASPKPTSAASFDDLSTPAGINYPPTRPRSARFVAEVDLFSESPNNERTDVYWLSTNRTRSHWILWTSYYDDEMGDGWVHQVYACMPRRGLDARQAAMALLECSWRAERDCEALTARPEGTVREGLLKAGDIAAVARSVWPN